MTQTVVFGEVVETDTANEVRPGRLISFARATETDTAHAFVHHRQVRLGRAIEYGRARRYNPRLAPATAPEWQLDVTSRTGAHHRTFKSTDAAEVSPVMDLLGREALADIAIGSITLPLTHASNADLDQDRLLHLSVRGHRVTTMLVKVPDLVVISRNEELDEIQHWNLETLFGILAEGDVDPPGGIGSKPAAADRIFDSSDPGRDNSDFTTPDELGTVADADVRYTTQPYGAGIIHRNDVKVIGPAGYSWGDDAPNGISYFCIDHNFSGGFFVARGTHDNNGELRIDGKTIEPFAWGYGQAYSVPRIFISPGVHRVWASVGNLLGPQTLALEFVKVDTAGNDTGLELVTSNAWKIDAFPAEPPGFTLGRLVRLVLEQNQTRGSLANVTLSCTDTHDSAGIAWANTWDISTKSSSPLSSFFLKELADTYADFAMRFVDGVGIVLDVFHKNGRGQHNAVALQRGVNIGSLAIAGAPTLATSFLTSWNDGGDLAYSRISVTPEAGHPVKEQPLSLGAQRSAGEMERVARGQLAQFARKRGKISVTHVTAPSTPDAEMPGLAYWVADTITVPTDAALTPGARRVIAMTWNLDKNTGQLVFTPELGDPIIAAAVRPAQTLRKLGAGTLAGHARTVSPVNPF